MDIVSEIDRLPQYYYTLKKGEIVLGGNSGHYDTEYDKANDHRSSMDRLYSIWKEIKEYYERDGEKEILPDKEKGEFAQTVLKMRSHCEGKKMNRDEIGEKVNSLSEEDKKELEWQIDMYKRGQYYYTRYVHR